MLDQFNPTGAAIRGNIYNASLKARTSHHEPVYITHPYAPDKQTHPAIPPLYAAYTECSRSVQALLERFPNATGGSYEHHAIQHATFLREAVKHIIQEIEYVYHGTEILHNMLPVFSLEEKASNASGQQR